MTSTQTCWMLAKVLKLFKSGTATKHPNVSQGVSCVKKKKVQLCAVGR